VVHKSGTSSGPITNAQAETAYATAKQLKRDYLRVPEDNWLRDHIVEVVGEQQAQTMLARAAQDSNYNLVTN